MNALFTAALFITYGEALSYGPFGTPVKPYPQEAVDAKSVLKYTGWQGPYSDRRGYGINRDPPAGTKVEQVVQLMRHGERWPDQYDWVEQQGSLNKILKFKGSLNGSLSFANYWEPFSSLDSGWNSEESLIGAYSGLLDAYAYGVDLRRRYYDLYDGQSTLPLFASGYERIVDTARKFGEGFLQWNYTQLAALNIIPETATQGANSLVPVCNANKEAPTICEVPKNITEANAPWLYPEYDTAVDRLNRENPSLNLVRADIPHLLGMTAFELNVRGSSPWVDVFTSEEWATFEYAQSSYYYCYYGPSSMNGPTQGSVFLNATRTLLVNGPDQGLPLYFSFAHDTDIINLVAAMGVDNVDWWNASSVHFGQRWDVTDLTPQGARILFERLVYADDADTKLAGETELAGEYPAAFNVTQNITAAFPAGGLNYSLSNFTWSNGTSGSNATANTTYTSGAAIPSNLVVGTNVTTNTSPANKTGNDNIFIRVVLNEAVVPLDGCTSGPGFSCPLSQFNDWVESRLAVIPAYDKYCNLTEDAPTYLSFFWDYNTTNTLDTTNGISFREGLVGWNDLPLSSS